MALIESGTHVIVDAELDSFATGEHTLSPALVCSLRPGMLVLADQGLPGVHLLNQVAASGADLLWRVNRRWRLTPQRVLPDGSWIATVRARGQGRETVRVIEYVLDDPGRDGRQRYRLITTIGDPQVAPAAGLGALYHERWGATRSRTSLSELPDRRLDG